MTYRTEDIFNPPGRGSVTRSAAAGAGSHAARRQEGLQARSAAGASSHGGEKNARTASGRAWRGIPQPGAQPCRSRAANGHPARQTAGCPRHRRPLSAAPWPREQRPRAISPLQAHGDPVPGRLRRCAGSRRRRLPPTGRRLRATGSYAICASCSWAPLYPAQMYAQTRQCPADNSDRRASRWRSSKAIAPHELEPRRLRSAAASVPACSARSTGLTHR
jgi:hypothetical protein